MKGRMIKWHELTRRRDPNEVVNFNRSTKKKRDRRNNRKNTKRKLQEIKEIDCTMI